MTRRRERQTARTLVRKGGAGRQPGKFLLVVTEGRRTEPAYIKALNERLRIRMKVVADATSDPVSLVHAAMQHASQQTHARRASALAIAFDEVWVVFDVEAPGSVRRTQTLEAMDLAQRNGIRTATSDPCFEYWLLLHWMYTTRPFPSCKGVVAELRACMPGYHKGILPSAGMMDALPTAIAHAQTCRKHHAITRGSGNPSTTVDLLVTSMNNSSRTGYQLDSLEERT